MERGFIWIFILLLSVSFVFAVDGLPSADVEPILPPEGEWGDINAGEESSAESQTLGEEPEVIVSISDDEEYSDEGEKYTSEFYIALGVGLVGIFIVILFVYLFVRRPKDMWKSKKSKIIKG